MHTWTAMFEEKREHWSGESSPCLFAFQPGALLLGQNSSWYLVGHSVGGYHMVLSPCLFVFQPGALLLGQNSSWYLVGHSVGGYHMVLSPCLFVFQPGALLLGQSSSWYLVGHCGWISHGFHTWHSSLQSGMLALWWEMLLNPFVTDVQCTYCEM